MTKLLRVLNLEDNPHDSMLLKRFLSKQHFSLTFLAVANEADFKEALKKFDWDVILADYTVPGFEAPLALKFLRRTGRDIPLIVLSGEMGEDVAVNVMRAGAADFILKDRMARLVPAIERELQEAGNRHERKRAETARLQTEARLRAILDHSPAAIYMKDRAGRYVLANRVCSDVFGTPSSEVLGKTDLELYPEPLAKSLRESDRRVIREGRPIQVEQQSAGDQQKDYLSVKFPVYDEKASVLGVGGIATDITSFKRTEEALRRSEKLATAGRLAATIAHEINNPLEAVVNILFLLARDENLPDRARELVAIADRELLRVSHIARQTLGFYRESTRATNFRVAEVAQQILDLYRRNCEKKQLHVLAELDPDATLYGLRGEIVQLFSNIIANAIDACGVGGAIRVRVRALRGSGNRAGSSGGVSIVVADNGVGISNSTAARIFEPFYTTKRDLGTGLGLWVTKNIVENHDGTIRLRSRFGSADSGTLFRIVLRGVAQEQKQTAAGLREAA